MTEYNIIPLDNIEDAEYNIIPVTWHTSPTKPRAINNAMPRHTKFDNVIRHGTRQYNILQYNAIQ